VSRPSDPPPSWRPGVPSPLTVAASIAGLEAVVLVIQGLTLLPALHGERLVMGATSVAFFLVYGAFLGFCAWQLSLLHSWARAPVVLAQLIQALVGASFWGGGTTAVALVAIVLAAVTLAGIFHPSSLAALNSAGRAD
jgi:hypothetical protein